MKNHEKPGDAPARAYEFGEFRLDVPRRRLLRRDGTPVPLTPRLLDALLHFVEHPGELLGKDALMQALWPGLVVEENNLNQAIAALRRALGDDTRDSRYIQTVPRRGFRFVAEVRRLADDERAASRAAGAAPVQALAVLPFQPLVDEASDELLEIGMADSLIARLSTVPDLAVRSVATVRRYAGRRPDPVDAARQLGVDWIIDGAVQRSGEQIRVTARLLRADGTSRWSGTFDEKYTSVFDLQDMISDRVARVISPRLGAHGARAVAASGTHDADAYQLYLAARTRAQGMRPSGLRKSVEFFRKAIELDPDYALAHAGMAETWRRLPFVADGEPAESFGAARAAALRALELDPSLAEGYSALGWVKWWHDWDWPGAEQAFRRAIELNPSVWEAHLGLGHFLSSQGRDDEGFPHVQRARELDPLSLITNTIEAGYLLARNRRADGEERLRRVLEIDPGFWIAHLTLASFHLADKDLGKAIDALQLAAANSEGESTQPVALMGFLLARSGRRDEARALLDRLIGDAGQRYVPPTSIAAIHSGLGETAAALDRLERGCEGRDVRMAFLAVDGRWAPLRGEPRFATLLSRLRLDSAVPGKSAH